MIQTLNLHLFIFFVSTDKEADDGDDGKAAVVKEENEDSESDSKSVVCSWGNQSKELDSKDSQSRRRSRNHLSDSSASKEDDVTRVNTASKR